MEEISYMEDHIVGLDVGVGASCIYPIFKVLRNTAGTFIELMLKPRKSLPLQKASSRSRPFVDWQKWDCRLQKKWRLFLMAFLGQREKKLILWFATLLFHASIEESSKGTRRKVKKPMLEKLISPQFTILQKTGMNWFMKVENTDSIANIDYR